MFSIRRCGIGHKVSLTASQERYVILILLSCKNHAKYRLIVKDGPIPFCLNRYDTEYDIDVLSLS